MGSSVVVTLLTGTLAALVVLTQALAPRLGWESSEQSTARANVSTLPYPGTQEVPEAATRPWLRTLQPRAPPLVFL